MKITDRFLAGIILGILLLVGVAFGAILLRPQPAFEPDGPPEAATHNYLLALRQAAYDRAYGYLSPDIAGYPATSEDFARDIREYRWDFRLDESSITLDIVSTQVNGDRATVTVRETRFVQGGLFDSGQSTVLFDVLLLRVSPDPTWLIVESANYWAKCWNTRGGCP